MSAARNTANLGVYSAPEIVALYAGLDYLTSAEQLLFRTYIPPGAVLMDLGVGGGRTTPYLSSIASTYVGVDYSEEMIRACRTKCPMLRFEVAMPPTFQPSQLARSTRLCFRSTASTTWSPMRSAINVCVSATVFSRWAERLSFHLTIPAPWSWVGTGTGIGCERWLTIFGAQ